VTITPSKLTRAAGMCAVAAGVLFVVIQFIHPHEIVANVTTTAWAVTHILTMAMGVLGLIGTAGMYLRQVTRAGLLGLIGFFLYGSFFVLTTALAFVEAAILPLLTGRAPQFVSDFLALEIGGTVVGDVGALPLAAVLSAVTYLLGGLLFGIALYRVRILARWASLLLAAGCVLTLAVPLIPHSLARMTALPVGVALAGLGYSLWREQRTAAARQASGVDGSRLDPAGAQ